MIEIKAISKKYGEKVAVRNLDLVVEKGKIFGFLGPNGAGKTTTIKMLVGLLKADTGDILVNGVDVRKDSLTAKSIIGYVPDEPVVYDKMTGMDYLKFIQTMYSVSSPDKIKELADRFEMTDKLGAYISSYSHGMKQKISVISALCHDPEILILDEPIQGLDPKGAFTLKEMLREHADKGKTVLFSTHVMEVAERLCDIVGIIKEGTIVAKAPFEELKERAGASGNATLEKIFLELTDENA